MFPMSRAWWIRRCLLSINVAAPVLLFATKFQNPWVIAGAVTVHTTFCIAVMVPGCGWFGPVVTRFRPEGREIWLTIDDGPDGAATEMVSAALAERGVKATFFVIGNRLAAQPGAAATLQAAGHSLANHTHAHPSGAFAWLWSGALRREVDGCQEALQKAGVAVRRWFRSPVGLKNTRLHPLLLERGMRLIAWDVRGEDGINCDPEAVAERVVARARPGSIVLLHEGRPRSQEAILRVVDALQQRGFSFVIPRDDQLVESL